MYWLPKNIPIIPKGLLEKLTLEQEQLREHIINTPLSSEITVIAGADSSIMGEQILSVFVMFRYPSLEQIELQYHISPIPLPYIPRFLSFREIPNLLEAYKKITYKPDLILVDGHGIMHPRRMGIATHLGLSLDIPTIGVAKKKLTGIYEIPADIKGSFTQVSDKKTKEVLGYALRSRDNVKPIFVSPGHRTDLQTALQITIQTLDRYKLPEPTRLADKYSKSLKSTI